MGNGTIIPSLVVWKGRVQLGGVTVEGEFKVFDSGGSWAFLLVKPLLHTKQAYEADTISIWGNNCKKENYSMRSKALGQGGTNQELTSC